PVKKKCPECSGLLVEKNTKDMGYHYSCINENCEYTEKMEG
ncbi:MAG: topoisomerase DNA-binding C4 zinc finger domain-containing protein, partial [Spirochaetes bacterium]|nr:topoisomerase DNA-binding C4 zinc finger domain-containing protein [Spirochaetota bacterium]